MSVGGYLRIEVLIECPECGDIFDLFEIDELREDGWLADVLMPDDESWGCNDFSERYEDVFGEDFKCPLCGKAIYIGTIEW